MFDLLHSDVFQKALLGGTAAAALAALVGYFLVLRVQAFAAEAFSDICFAGATGAALLGQSPLVGMIAFSLLSALSLGAMGDRARGRSVEIGMVLSFALGLGVLFLSIYTRSSASHANAGVSILFGSILSVRPADIYRMLAAGGAALVTLAVVYRPLLFASVDPAAARARGVPVRALSVVFLLVLALAAAACTFVVGVLLASALLIAPAAAAVRMAHRPLHTLLLSLAFGVFITWAGLLVSFIGPWRHPPVGFSISALAAIVYAAASILGRRGHPRRFSPAVDLDREVRDNGAARVIDPRGRGKT
jgi:zinc/manganese transport system permease protein